MCTKWSNATRFFPPTAPFGPVWRALRAVVPRADGPQHPRAEPAPRLHPGRAARGGEGDGGRPGRPQRGPGREVLQPHPDDRQGAAAAHRREFSWTARSPEPLAHPNRSLSWTARSAEPLAHLNREPLAHLNRSLTWTARSPEPLAHPNGLLTRTARSPAPLAHPNRSLTWTVEPLAHLNLKPCNITLYLHSQNPYLHSISCALCNKYIYIMFITLVLLNRMAFHI